MMILNGSAEDVCALVARSIENDLAKMLEHQMTEHAKPIIRSLALNLAKQINAKMETHVDFMHAQPIINIYFNDKLDVQFKQERSIVEVKGPLSADN